MTHPHAIELDGVAKVYATGIAAVDDVSLTVPAGTVVALLGSSGCGKTTTLRLVNRLEDPTRGCVRVRGSDVRAQRPEQLRRSIGYVIQDAGLFPHWTVAGNVATVPRLIGWPRAQIERRVADVLELVGLAPAEFAARLPSQLSGGQRQRVGVARALAADPDILLMDEPFGALDPGTRQKLQDEFLELQRRLRKTVMLVTHDIAEAAKLADEIVLMDRGRVLQRGSLGDLLVRPQSERVRLFIGSIRHTLALESLRLGDLIDGLVPVASSAAAQRVSPDLHLPQALAALADLAPSVLVAIDGGTGRTYTAGTLRTRIIQELEKTP